MLTGLHHRDRNGEGRRIRASDLMHVTHPLWLTELCPRKWWERRVLPSLPLACQTSALLMSYVPKMERVNGVAPSSQPWHGRILLLNHTRFGEPPANTGVPSGTLTGILTLRTRPLCALSYGDGKWSACRVTLPDSALI